VSSRARALAPDTPQRAEILRALRRVLDWLTSLRDERGRIWCPEHRIEHTGKSAYVPVLALELLPYAADAAERAALVALMRQQGARLVARLEREGASECFTFRPGRHDPYNCSNSVIDGGACADALATLVLDAPEHLTEAERASFAEASVLHARTYLRYAVLDKGIPAQRAWGLTGLAGAARLSRDPELAAAAMQAVGVLESVQNQDGSFPYHPVEWGAGHVGASDVSSFYQSRCSGFVLDALERLGRDPRDGQFAPALRRGLDFTLALVGPDGLKVGLVEAKPWYWGATYEVASHVYDVQLFARGHELWGAPAAARGAALSVRAWVRHLEPSGRPRSHLAGPGRARSYQCPLFWAAHSAWIARAIPALERCLAHADRETSRAASAPASLRPAASIDLSVTWFPDASLARLEDGAVVAWVRGARPGFNVLHGSPHGAGLLRAVRKSDGAELVERCRLGGHEEAEWSGRAGGFSLARGWRACGGELGFSLWLARAAWRGRRPLDALRAPLRILRDGVLAFGSARVGSAFHLAPSVRVLPDGVILESALARRSGEALPDARTERRFLVEGTGLAVVERLLAAGPARNLDYRVPRRAVQVQRSPNEVRYRLE
jgi:hypothetical protein